MIYVVFLYSIKVVLEYFQNKISISVKKRFY